jgi:hypothetical protein
MAAAVVLALGIIIVGVMGVAYMLYTSAPQPTGGEPTSVPSPQPTLQGTELLGRLTSAITRYDWDPAGDIAGNHEKGADTAVTHNDKPSAYLSSTSARAATGAQLSKLWSTQGYHL